MWEAIKWAAVGYWKHRVSKKKAKYEALLTLEREWVTRIKLQEKVIGGAEIDRLTYALVVIARIQNTP